VTPQIDDKGNILLHVHPSVSQVSTVNVSVSLGTAGNLSLPLAASATSEVDSMVRGQDGRVVAIGGLMRQSSTELVVLIKPTIVEGSNNWNQDMLDTSRRIEQLDPRKTGRR
jgi:MSHA biogenesis protein MshL